jgi:hypothetical protein
VPDWPLGADSRNAPSCSCHADATHLFDNADGDEAALIYLVSEEG